MQQLISAPLTLAGENNSDYAADHTVPGDSVSDGMLPSVTSKWIYWKQESTNVLWWISGDLHLVEKLMETHYRESSTFF